jgi:hypothetical protein
VPFRSGGPLVFVSLDEPANDLILIGEQVWGIEDPRSAWLIYVGGHLDKASYRRRADELDARQNHRSMYPRVRCGSPVTTRVACPTQW